jgi:hypothetical protein
MAYINQPPDLRVLFSDLDQRLRKLELATRFTAPDVPTEPTYPRVADIIYENTDDQMKYWNGTEWVVFADNNVGVPIVPYTPVWGSLGTQPVYGAGAITGRYIKISKWCFFSVRANLSSVTNFGTGQYTLTIPFTPLQSNAFRDGGLHEGTNHYGIMLDVTTVGGTTGKLYYPGSSGKDEPFDRNSPHVLTTSDFWYISGAYFIA